MQQLAWVQAAIGNTQLPEYGHDLRRCLRKAKELGLTNAVSMNRDEDVIDVVFRIATDCGVRAQLL